MKKIYFKYGLTSLLVLIISLFIVMNSASIKVDAAETYPTFDQFKSTLTEDQKLTISSLNIIDDVQDDGLAIVSFDIEWGSDPITKYGNYFYCYFDTKDGSIIQYLYDAEDGYIIQGNGNLCTDENYIIGNGRFHYISIDTYGISINGGTQEILMYVSDAILTDETVATEFSQHVVAIGEKQEYLFDTTFGLGTFKEEEPIELGEYELIYQQNLGTANLSKYHEITSSTIKESLNSNDDVIFEITSTEYNFMFKINDSINMWDYYEVYGAAGEKLLTYSRTNGTDNGYVNILQFLTYTQFSNLVINVYAKEIISDTVEPMISTEAYIYVTDVNNPKTVAQVMTDVDLQAYDEIDGDLTNEIVITSDGGYETSVLTPAAALNTKAILLGDYAISFSVEDSSGNEATASIIVRVVDTTIPTVGVSSTLTRTVGYSSTPITNETILAGVIAEDNHDGTPSKVITVNNYNQTTTVGSYTVTVRITDDSGNYKDQLVTIQVYDNVAPIFSGATTFYKSYDIAKSVNDIMAFCEIAVDDAIDGELDIVVESDTYTGQSNVPGTYTIVLKATDIRGNQSTHTITVTVADEVVPYFLINRNKVIIQPGVNFTPTMLVSTLRDVGVIQNTSLSFAVINDTYTGNESTPGTYAYDLRVLYQNGQEELIDIEVEVLEPEDPGTNVDADTDPFFVKVWNFVKKLGGWIAFPFVWLYNNVLKQVFTFQWVKDAWAWVKGLFVKI